MAAPRIRIGKRRQPTITILGVKLVQTGLGWATADGRWRLEWIDATPGYWGIARTDGSPIWPVDLAGVPVTETYRRSRLDAVKAIRRAEAMQEAA